MTVIMRPSTSAARVAPTHGHQPKTGVHGTRVSARRNGQRQHCETDDAGAEVERAHAETAIHQTHALSI